MKPLVFGADPQGWYAQLINATYHNETHVSCKVPSYGSAVSTRLQLIESTNEIIEVGPFTWYESPSIENVEPQEGTTPINVTLTGNGFINTTALQCRYVWISFLRTTTCTY